MARSIEFYKKLGFEVANYYPKDRPDPDWVWLQAGGANLMLVEASEKVIPSQQAVIFYVYVEGVAAFRDEWLQQVFTPARWSIPSICRSASSESKTQTATS